MLKMHFIATVILTLWGLGGNQRVKGAAIYAWMATGVTSYVQAEKNYKRIHVIPVHEISVLDDPEFQRYAKNPMSVITDPPEFPDLHQP
jgi:hypothetical protein